MSLYYLKELPASFTLLHGSTIIYLKFNVDGWHQISWFNKQAKLLDFILLEVVSYEA